MQEGGLLQVCQCKQPRIYDGATNAMMKQRKEKVKASSGTKTLGTISNMGMENLWMNGLKGIGPGNPKAAVK
jgi:hypothetical protein